MPSGRRYRCIGTKCNRTLNTFILCPYSPWMISWITSRLDAANDRERWDMAAVNKWISSPTGRLTVGGVQVMWLWTCWARRELSDAPYHKPHWKKIPIANSICHFVRAFIFCHFHCSVKKSMSPQILFWNAIFDTRAPRRRNIVITIRSLPE